MRPAPLILCVSLGFVSCDGSGDALKAPANVTWSDHVAPVIYKHCSSCHRPGEGGPFELLSYEDAVKKANQIRFMTRTRQMPPWPADPSYSHFLGENVLSDKQIALISSWVEQGTPRGDSAVEPPAPRFHRGSFFGKPDLVISCPDPVRIKGNGEDVFLVMKYPYHIPNDTFADVIEFVPDQRRLVHHVNGHLLSYDAKRSKDQFGGKAVHADTRSRIVDVYREMHIPYTDGLQPEFPPITPNTVYYLPGFVPPVYPNEIGGLRLSKDGAFLLNNIHYGPSNADVTDSSHINVFFRKQKVTRPLQEMQMGTFGVSEIIPPLVIPANEVKTFYTSTTIAKDISILSVNPHMHLLGKTFLAYAIRPGGDTVHLIKINKWNFRWQYYYTFTHPVKIEAGSTIHVYGTYDNTKDNTDNPYFPPRTISQGEGIESMKTSEEMFQFIFTFLPYKEGDEQIDLGRKDGGI
jgi:mono/diheme cytochrome c family protein